MLEDETECALAVDRRIRRHVLPFPHGGLESFATVNPRRDSDTREEQNRCEQHDAIRSKRLEQPSGEKRSEDRAQRAADSGYREQTPALFLRIDVVCECPDLSHEHEIEQADPDEERNRDR